MLSDELRKALAATRREWQALNIKDQVYKVRTARIEDVARLYKFFCYEEEADDSPLWPCDCYGPFLPVKGRLNVLSLLPDAKIDSEEVKAQHYINPRGELCGCAALAEREWYLPLEVQDEICLRLWPLKKEDGTIEVDGYGTITTKPANKMKCLWPAARANLMCQRLWEEQASIYHPDDLQAPPDFNKNVAILAQHGANGERAAESGPIGTYEEMVERVKQIEAADKAERQKIKAAKLESLRLTAAAALKRGAMACAA